MSILKRVLKYTVTFFAVFLILILIAFGLIQTRFAKNKLAQEMSAALSTPERKIQLGQIEGFIPFRIHLSSLTISDYEGRWLTAQDVSVLMRFLPLVRGRISIEDLSASRLFLARMPAKKEKKKEWQPPQLPQKIPAVEIDSFQINNFITGEGLLGKSMAFQAEGHLWPKTGNALQAFLHLVSRNHSADILINASLHGSPRALQLEIKAKDPEGEITEGIPHLSSAGPIHLSLSGDGPFTNWQGVLKAGFGKIGSVFTEMKLDLGRIINIGLAGSYTPSPLLIPADLRQAVGSTGHFKVVLAAVPYKHATLQKSEFSSSSYAASASGNFNFESNLVEAFWDLSLPKLKVLEPALNSPISGKMMAKGQIEGKVSNPSAGISAQITNLAFSRYQSENMTLDVKAVPQGPLLFSKSPVRVLGEIEANGIRIRNGKPLPAEAAKVNLNLLYRNPKSLDVDDLTVVTQPAALKASGHLNPSSLEAQIKAEAELKELGSITGYFGRRIEGSSSLKGEFSGDFSKRSVKGSVSGVVSDLTPVPKPLDDFVARTNAFSWKFAFNKSSLMLSGFKVENPLLQVTATGSADFSHKLLKGSWEMLLPDLEGFARGETGSFSGQLRADGKIRGRFNSFETEMRIAGGPIIVNGVALSSIQTELSAQGLPEKPQGSTSSVFIRPEAKLDFAAEFLWNKKVLALSPITMQSGRNFMQAELIFDGDKKLAAGNVNARFEDLSTFGLFTGEPLRGSAALQAVFSPDQGRQHLALKLNANDLTTNLGAVKYIRAEANVSNLKQFPTGDISLDVNGYENKTGLTISSGKFQAQSDEKNGSFSASISGRYKSEYDLMTKGSLTLAGPLKSLHLQTFDGRFGPYRLALQKAADFSISPRGYTWENVHAIINTGDIQSSGHVLTDSLVARTSFTQVPLGISSLLKGPDLAGVLSGRLALNGSPANPQASFDCQVENFALPETESFPPAYVRTRGQFRSKRLTGNAWLQLQGEQPAEAVVSLPLIFSMKPVNLTIIKNEPFSLRGSGRTDLSLLSAFLPEDSELSGPAAFNVDMGGTLAEPSLKGQISIEGGHFENLSTGTMLQNIMATMTAADDVVYLTAFQASDDKGGSVTAVGNLGLGKQFPISLNANLANANLVRRDDINATLDGSVGLSGTAKNLLLEGNIRIPNAEINIPRSLPPSIPELEVTEINLPVSAAPAQPASKSPPLNPRLQLNISAPGNIVARGRGLDSEWKADLQVRGSTARPVVVGRVDLVRGRFDFFGKQLQLTEGDIRFYGRTPPSPTINAAAQTKTQNMTAFMNVSGQLKEPKISFSSEPPLPSDEVLSQLLFGRDVSSITPLQAVQMVNALNTLRGGGNTLGFLGSARKFLGLETLGVSPAQGGATVEIGKEIAPNIRVSAQEGIGTQTSQVGVEIEVSPHLDVRTNVGTSTGSGVEVNWKKDY